ncbi:hypothetical protein CN946_02580 [Bacillus sp. AFS053548]|nr:hypothetical protein CN946_02580 [Bacillus sp. AFS053548]
MASVANKKFTIVNKLFKKCKSEKNIKTENIFHFFYYNCIKSTNGIKTGKYNSKSYRKNTKGGLETIYFILINWSS